MNESDDSGFFSVNLDEGGSNRELNDARYPWVDAPTGHGTWLEWDDIRERLSSVDGQSFTGLRRVITMMAGPDANGHLHWIAVEQVDHFLREAAGKPDDGSWFKGMADAYQAMFDAGVWIREGERIRYDDAVFLVLPDEIDPNEEPEVEA
jgi:hypothetical protein